MFTSLPELVNIAGNLVLLALHCSLRPTARQPSLRGVRRAAGLNDELVEIWKEETVT